MARELTVWKPPRQLAPFERMKREMDRMWDSFFEGGPRFMAEEGGEWLPALDLAETGNEFVVKAEMPGLDAKDIDISLSENMLTIKGEKKRDREETKENYHFMERSYGAFTRSIQLPGEVNHQRITTSYKNGVLKIHLPKSEEAKKREVKIKVQ